MSAKVDNFDRARPLLEFDDAHYCHIELIVRQKDFLGGECQDDPEDAELAHMRKVRFGGFIEERNDEE